MGRATKESLGDRQKCYEDVTRNRDYIEKFVNVRED